MLIILCKARHAENLNRGSDRADGVELRSSGGRAAHSVKGAAPGTDLLDTPL